MFEWVMENTLFVVLGGLVAALLPVAFIFRRLNKRAEFPHVGRSSSSGLMKARGVEPLVKPYIPASNPSTQASAINLPQLEERIAKLEEKLEEVKAGGRQRIKVICPEHGEVEPLKMVDGTLICPHLHRLYPPEDQETGSDRIRNLERKVQELEARLERLQRWVNRHLMESG